MMLFNDLVSGTPTIVTGTASRRRLEIGPCENDQISFSNFPFVRDCRSGGQRGGFTGTRATHARGDPFGGFVGGNGLGGSRSSPWG
jgi:hypothetical protein